MMLVIAANIGEFNNFCRQNGLDSTSKDKVLWISSVDSLKGRSGRAVFAGNLPAWYRTNKDQCDQLIEQALKRPQDVNAKYKEQWDYPSDTRPGLTYVVSKTFSGEFQCSCPAWKFARMPKPDCKHIIDTMKNCGLLGDILAEVKKTGSVQLLQDAGLIDAPRRRSFINE